MQLHEASSTQDVAREGVEQGRFGASTVVVADRQTSGRGRRGRSWFTLPGRSLATSIVVRPPPLARPTRLSILTAVAARRALARTGVHDVLVKWPNDLMRGERKIGGLLIDTSRTPSGEALAIIGVGINLIARPGDVPAELEPLVGDAGLPRGPADRDRLLTRLVAEVDRACAEVGSPADRARGEEFRRCSWLDGREVVLTHAGQQRALSIAEVTPEGDLVTAEGELLEGELVELVQIKGGASTTLP